MSLRSGLLALGVVPVLLAACGGGGSPVPVCGDGIKAIAEACDDGNTTNGDGCSATCTISAGYTCAGSPSVCATTCGDGIKAGAEACDDGNTTTGDGCSSACTVEVAFAPPIDPTVATDIFASTAFLHTGVNPIQAGVTAGTIDPRRVSVLRGKVLNRDDSVLPGAVVSVLGHPELGSTISRADGMFDLAVNGGGELTLRYEKAGFLAVQRAVVAPWRDYAWMPDVVMVPLDTAVTTVTLGAATLQVARGSSVSDSDGTRRATVLVPPGTTASLVLPDGTSRPLSTISVRATEFTVGKSGPRAMPASLPPSSGYTYAAELSVDEAISAGAVEVRFSQPLPVYVENFLGFPVGGAVPSGSYDRQQGRWRASADGRVIKLLGVTGGLADLDVSGGDTAASPAALASLGIIDQERARLALLYAPGQSIWRVPVTHFTPWDFNWPFGPPAGAASPPSPEDGSPIVDDPGQECGSVIGCEDQTLGESVPVTGTPWRLHYQSDRVPGRTAERELLVVLSGAAPLPAGLKRIELEISVAGRRFSQAFAATPGQSYRFTWDGQDAYGRALQGSQLAAVTVGYVYGGVYLQPSEKPGDGYDSLFGHWSYFGAPVSANLERAEVTLLRRWTASVGAWDGRGLGLGGWSLGLHHAYDPMARRLYLGDGRQRRAEARAAQTVVVTVAGNGVQDFSGDQGPATKASLNNVRGVAASPDGSLYLADTGNQRIRRVAPDGVITTVAGTGVFGFSGDGGPATAAQLFDPQAVAVGSDGSLYIADYDNHRIRRVGPDGIISTVAGTGVGGFGGDGGAAAGARLNGPSGVAVRADGTLFIADSGNHRIRRVWTDGTMSTVTGDGFFQSTGDGGPAGSAQVAAPTDVALGPDGSLFIAEYGGSRIRQVRPDGIISTVAGTGVEGFGGDGGPATEARLARPAAIAVGPDGSLYVADRINLRVRRVGIGGSIRTIAGNGTPGYSGDGGPATAAQLADPTGLSVGPDGNIYIADNTNRRIARIQSAHAGYGGTELLFPSEDGRELYVFNSVGRHLRTMDALTGALRHAFSYGPAGYLVSVADGSGNLTTIERSGAVATAIVAPGGQRTALTVDARGWLEGVANPAGETHVMSHSSGGLLQTFTDPRGSLHRFTYDTVGRLVEDHDPLLGSTTLVRTEQGSGYTVTTTSTLGRAHLYQVERLPAGAVRRAFTGASGATSTRLSGSDGSEQRTSADGTTTSLIYRPDPRFGMLAPIAASVIEQRPSGLRRTVTATRSAALANAGDPLSLTRLVETINDNGAVSSWAYSHDGVTRSITHTSAAGRGSVVTLDELGRAIEVRVPGLDPASFTYDARGLLSTVTEGTGGGNRTSSLSYNGKHELVGASDPLLRTVGMSYDAAGRVVALTLPGARAVAFGYDAAGNVTAVTPPGRTAHAFDYSSLDQVASYTPPGGTATRYGYDPDGALTTVTVPGVRALTVAYDGAGRASTLAMARGSIGYTFDGTSGQLTGVTAPGGLGLVYAYDGDLLTSVTWSGAVAGSAGYTYDSDLRVTEERINSANGIGFTYDADGLLTAAGGLVLAHDATSGLLTGSTLGGVTDTLAYSSLGEPTSYVARHSTTDVFGAAYTRDALGRVTRLVETVLGATTTYDFGYAAAGFLNTVTRDAVAVGSYSYDANGNRTAANGVSATYDAQDRLTTLGGTSYSYTAGGELLGKVTGIQTTTYQYDELGNLLQVTLPDGTVIEYLIDGAHRRVGRKVNGALVQGFLYQDALRPVVELDGGGAVVSRFVYATHANVPDYLVKGGATYRIITDHLGSPRVVIDVASGTVAQRLDYDAFGRVLGDSNPGFQPFGFGGGLYDRDTRLVRFGARDYDAETGRWTAKDPLGFMAGDANLYAYVGNDPMNRIDPSGLAEVCATDRHVRPGDTLFISTHGFRPLSQPRLGSAPIGYVAHGTPVIFRGFAPNDSRLVQIEVNGQGGYVLRESLSTRNFETEVLPGLPLVGKPMSAQAFPSSGAGTKG